MRQAIALLTIGFALLSAPADRFDNKVREKFFAGFAGDEAALTEGMRICEAILAEHPDHAEAMVWYGSGIFMRASAAFRAKDQAKGIELYTKAVETMDRAVSLAPDSVAVRVPRGATMLAASRFMPKSAGQPLLERGLSDYEHVLAMQESHFDKLSQHARGELLFGLAEGWSRAGDAEKATGFFNRILQNLPQSPYAQRADKWLRTRTLAANETGCIGCHTGN